jgi:AcrR family transcriptional regulator
VGRSERAGGRSERAGGRSERAAGRAEQVGGRPRQIDEAAIVHAGRELGMAELSMNAVASRLGVTSTALYRHVEGRWGLERLVGESLLEELRLPDDPALDLVPHLVAFGTGLRAFTLEHPGLAAYLQTLFPRGEGGRRVLAEEIEALTRRGYAPDAALVVCSGIAAIAIGYAAAADVQRSRGEELGAQEQAAWAGVHDDARLDPAHEGLPEVDPAQYARLMLTVVAQGLVTAAPPGRPVAEVIAALEAVAPSAAAAPAADPSADPSVSAPTTPSAAATASTTAAGVR